MVLDTDLFLSPGLALDFAFDERLGGMLTKELWLVCER